MSDSENTKRSKSRPLKTLFRTKTARLEFDEKDERLFLDIDSQVLGFIGVLIESPDGVIRGGTASYSAISDFLAQNFPAISPEIEGEGAHKVVNVGEIRTLIQLSTNYTLNAEEPENEKPMPLIPASIVNIDERDARTLLYEFKTEKDMQDYRTLLGVLFDSLDQAAYGKGKERHANDLPFEEQRMTSISKALNSPLGMAYQAIKKVQEGVQFEETERVIKELHGAIVYIAGMILWYQNQPPK